MLSPLASQSPQGTARLMLVDTTLREGEQFLRAHFTSAQRLTLARMLDAFGVEVIELPSPRLSPQTERDVRAIAAAGLSAQLAAHVRCADDDVDAALASGVKAIHLFYGTSQQLRDASHRRDLSQIAAEAVRQVERVRAAGLYVRFSAEDAFRTSFDDLVAIFDPVVAAGVDCIGLPDTVGVATPSQVAERVSFFRERYPAIGIEFHGHNDTGCAIANALAASESGATRIDVTVLGIGERNGIASLSGVIAGLCSRQPQTLGRYELSQLPELDRFVADLLGMPVPFNSPITSEFAFAHRAGIHTNAVLRAPSAYEALDPAAFGLTRTIDTASRVVGRHALQARAAALGLSLDDKVAGLAIAEVKRMGDAGPMDQAQVDAVIRQFVTGRAAVESALKVTGETHSDEGVATTWER